MDVSLDVSSGSSRHAESPGDPGVAAPDPETPRNLPDTGGVLEPFMAAAVATIALAGLVRRLLGRVPAPVLASVSDPFREDPR